MLKDNLVFLTEFINEFQLTGSFCPTSKWAASAMVLPLRERNGNKLRILELGPGSGAVTFRILEQLKPQDELAICEINPRFMDVLKGRLEEIPAFQRHKARICFHQCPAQELPEGRKFDVIVCSLPFLNFDLDTVEQIFEKIKRISHEETVMTYYEYIGLRAVGSVFSGPKTKTRLRQLDRFFASVFENHLEDRRKIWANILPINVYRLSQVGALKAAVGCPPGVSAASG